MIRRVLKWLAVLFGRDTTCTHPNATCFKWLDKDGRPMIDQRCPDCGDSQYGHVRDADPSTWTENQAPWTNPNQH
jgi:hypothetical protein